MFISFNVKYLAKLHKYSNNPIISRLLESGRRWETIGNQFTITC
jgi:hypothetical protein